MQPGQFKALTAEFSAATAAQILQLEAAIKHIASERVAEMALARRTIRSLWHRCCAHCRSRNVVLHGRDGNGRQRFKCRGCCRTYNILTGTPMARARKPEKWGRYLACMTSHVTVRAIVRTGIGVNHVTAWRWRHRFLQAAAEDGFTLLSGIIEVAETFFPRSFKGRRRRTAAQSTTKQNGGCLKARQRPRDQVPVLSAVDSGGGMFDAILASIAGVKPALEGRIAPGSVLCSSGSASYVKVADQAGAEHYMVHAPIPGRTPGRLDLGRVNRHRRHLQDLVYGRCRGVATKYLDSYLGWNRCIRCDRFVGRMLLDRALGHVL